MRYDEISTERLVLRTWRPADREPFAALNADPEMKELAAKAGFELVNVGVDGMDAFMRTRTRIYTDVGKRMGLGGAK